MLEPAATGGAVGVVPVVVFAAIPASCRSEAISSASRRHWASAAEGSWLTATSSPERSCLALKERRGGLPITAGFSAEKN